MPIIVESNGPLQKEFNVPVKIDHEPVFEHLKPKEKTKYRKKERSRPGNTVESPLKYHTLKVSSRGHVFKPGGLSRDAMMAGFLLNTDVSFLFPYLNAVAERAELHQEPQLIRFQFEDRYCVLYPQKGLVTPIEDRPRARFFLDRLIAFLNDISSQRDQITSNHRIHRRVSVPNILKLLPKTNCGACGQVSCMAFAASVSLQESFPDDCPHIVSPLGEQATYPVFNTEGKLLSTVVININTAKNSPQQNGAKESLNPKPTGRSKKRAEKGGNANMSLPMPLSARELEVLCILAEGTSNNEISCMLSISPHTVKSHVIHIFNKLGVNDRTQAAVWAARHNLI